MSPLLYVEKDGNSLIETIMTTSNMRQCKDVESPDCLCDHYIWVPLSSILLLITRGAPTINPPFRTQWPTHLASAIISWEIKQIYKYIKTICSQQVKTPFFFPFLLSLYFVQVNSNCFSVSCCYARDVCSCTLGCHGNKLLGARPVNPSAIG